jgi:hypothetical protein
MKRIFFLTLLTAVFSLLGLAGFNYILDPYLVFSTQADAPLQLPRYAIGRNERMHKAAQIDYYKPDFLVLGWSRARDGIDPTQAEIMKRYHNPYNAAQAVQRLQEAEAYYAHARCGGNLKAVLWNVDFGMFSARHDAFNRSYREGLLRGENCERKPVIEKVRISFSWQTGIASAALLYQPARPNFFTDRGMTNPAYYSRSKRRPYEQFLRAEKQYQDDVYKDYVLGEKQFDAFRRVLDTAHKQGHELTLFISPSHARLWEVMDRVVGWAVFEQWKRQLVTINHEVALAHGTVPFPLWDFSGYHPLQVVRLPSPKQVRPNMRHYWDTSHFKKEMGDIMLRRMYGAETKYKNFGVLLSVNNIDSHLVRLRQQRDRWVTRDSQFIQDVAGDISK